MIILTGQVGRPKWEPLIAGRSMGMLLSPAAWRSPWTQFYDCDNDVFSHCNDPDWWDREGESRWLRMLDKIPSDKPPLFVLLPDVVADWLRTLERAHRYRDELFARNLPCAVALQDGCIFEQALSVSPSTVFVGGSLKWKWANVEAITDFFHGCDKRVHVGRVNGPERTRECLRVGVDSCDGTGYARFSDAMLPPLFRLLDGKESQMRMAI